MNRQPQPGYLSILDSRGDPIPIAARADTYEGAATGRRLNTWGTSSAGPNTALFASLGRLRARSRELIRNNPLADGGVDTLVANLIGTGIAPRWQLADKGLKKEIHDLWNDWVSGSDHAGLQDFYGQQALVSRALIDAGECLARLHYLYPDESPSVPLQIQLLEADHLDEQYNTVSPKGNEIRMGIEFNPAGRRTAYWLFREHPGEAFVLNRRAGDRVRVSSRDMIHCFRPLRIGQMRGRPWLTSIIVKLHEIDQYDDAEIVRKKTAALFGGFITETAPDPFPGSAFGRPAGKDANQSPIIALEPGTFPILPAGKSVVFSEPADVGQTYELWMKKQLRDIAAGLGITYDQLTGDLSDVNYSSIRAGLLEFRRRVRQLQFQTIIFQFCRPIAHAFLDTAVLNGLIRIRDYMENRRLYRRIEWRPDGWEWVDPVKDQVAAQMSVRNGFASRAKVVAELGDDVEMIDEEIDEDNRRADEKGLILDSDPRRTAASGVMQKVVEGNLNP